MKAEVKEKLRSARDFYGLTKDILALCEPFGPVHSFRFVHNRLASRVACFIELESPKQQPALARSLGTGAMNGTVCLDVPVSKDFGVRDRIVPLTPAHGYGAQSARATNAPANR